MRWRKASRTCTRDVETRRGGGAWRPVRGEAGGGGNGRGRGGASGPPGTWQGARPWPAPGVRGRLPEPVTRFGAGRALGQDDMDPLRGGGRRGGGEEGRRRGGWPVPAAAASHRDPRAQPRVPSWGHGRVVPPRGAPSRRRTRVLHRRPSGLLGGTSMRRPRPCRALGRGEPPRRRLRPQQGDGEVGAAATAAGAARVAQDRTMTFAGLGRCPFRHDRLVSSLRLTRGPGRRPRAAGDRETPLPVFGTSRLLFLFLFFNRR